ncbi:MAG: flavodoxin family protein [Anaerolineales bacterium]
MKAVIVSWSRTGNTGKASRALLDGLEESGMEVEFLQLHDAADLDWFDYDLICVAFPVYRWSPPQPVDEWLSNRFRVYGTEKQVKIGAPRISGRHAVVLVTYSGPHTGIREAVPAALYAEQFFEHLGFTIFDPLYVVGEYHGSEARSLQGPLGDTRGRPNARDLAEIHQRGREIGEEIRWVSRT